MKRLFVLYIIFSWPLFGQTYDAFFLKTTMRVDYYHIGTKEKEYITLDKVYEESAWPGSINNLLDTLNLGDSFVTISDLQTGMLLYSRGYSTLFNEWQTTDESINGTWKTFHETVRFPFPRRKVMAAFFRRDKFVAAGEMMAFREMFSVVIDPNDPTAVNRKKHTSPFKEFDVMINGPVEKKVDILIVGDGYTKDDMEKFRNDAQHFTETLFSYQPFKKHKEDFNVRALEVVSEDSGIDKPDQNIWKNTALGTSYNTFGSIRYILTEENRALRDIAGIVPYDFITILVNDNRYGGGGIFNLYTTCFTKAVQPGQEWERDYVYVHEFGHCFGGLADEYYGSQVSYNDFYQKGVEPWEPNITRMNRSENLKWKQFVSKSVPLPTPWKKSEYDSIEALRGQLGRLAPDYYQKRESLLQQSRNILKDSQWSGKVGAFEGAGYMSRGMYRPSIDCKMFALNPVDYDPVCSAAIERMIALYTH
jgi:IgA Peptidase M64/Peptidase M64 N-terminus